MGESFVGIDEFGEVWNQSIKFKKGLCSGFIDLCSCFKVFVQPEIPAINTLDLHNEHGQSKYSKSKRLLSALIQQRFSKTAIINDY